MLWRLPHSLVVLNRFPYTGGHCLVAPVDHVGGMDELEADVILEMMSLVCDMQKILTHAIRAQGFNIGVNIGRCAGAGLPGHLHIHIVPRWDGDTNFMAVFGDVRVIPQSLDALYLQLREAGEQLALPAATR